MLFFNKKYYLVVAFIALLYVPRVQSQSSKFIPPTIENPNNAEITWNEDGSVTVKGGPVFFTSGISAAPTSNHPNIEIDKMVLVDATSYYHDEDDLNEEFGIDVDLINNENNISLAPNVKVEVYRRPEFQSIYNFENFDYGFIFNDDYLVYGNELTDYDPSTGISTYNPRDVFAYRKGHWDITKSTKVKSNDYTKLWNRPMDASNYWYIPAGIVVTAALVYANPPLARLFIKRVVSRNGVLAAAFATSAYKMYNLDTPTFQSVYESYDDPDSNDMDEPEFARQFRIRTPTEIIVPTEIDSDEEGAEEYNNFVEQSKAVSFKCSTDTSLDCYSAPYEAVVVKLEATNTTIKSINIPGRFSRTYTPYQMFDNFYYQTDQTGKIVIDINGLTETNSEQKFSQIKKLPKKIYESNVDKQYTLEFAEYIGFPYFYLVAQQELNGVNDFYAINLGKFGEIQENGATIAYNLYRYQAKFSNVEGTNPLATITLGPNGPFLAADNTISSTEYYPPTYVNGVNYSIRPIVTYGKWKEKAGGLARPITDEAINADFQITNCVICGGGPDDDNESSDTGEGERIAPSKLNDNVASSTNFYKWEIAFPRQLKHRNYGAPIRKAADKYPEYGCNIALYPNLENLNDNVIYLVASSNPVLDQNDSRDLRTLQEKEAAAFKTITDFPFDTAPGEITRLGKIFDAYHDGTPTKGFPADGRNRDYFLFRLEMVDNKRVLLRNINPGYGPFPLGRNGIVTKQLQDTPINHKFLNKSSIPENARFIVAWHRGSWKNVPENSIPAITAAAGYDLIELDISYTKIGVDPLTKNWDPQYLNSETNLPHLMLFHDPFMFRVAYQPDEVTDWDTENKIGPNESGCVQPYDPMMMPWILTQRSQKAELLNYIDANWRQSASYFDDFESAWIKEPNSFTYRDVKRFKLRDRFGCQTDENIPDYEAGIEEAKKHNLFISLDKGELVMDAAYWYALEHDYENNISFKDKSDHTVANYIDLYGNEFFKQTIHTPWIFEGGAQNSDGITKIKQWMAKEESDGWHIPAIEVQMKLRTSDANVFSLQKGIQNSHGFSSNGTEYLLNWIQENTATKWIGVTPITPTSGRGFDNKFLYMNAPDSPLPNPQVVKEQNPEQYQLDPNAEAPLKSSLDNNYDGPDRADPISSRFDRRGDFLYNIYYAKQDYFITDRPAEILRFLKEIGKNVQAPDFD
ncbi:glycerophosphodiester phosphodiesterase family protein [Gaetbulibacter sp. M240]|uniref:glycerophosphodiester phosphodiesterase family protein n=1 Tax=Gaetbulibacter sp. M240 TaxID=3126511 RepID=UPI00374ED10F